MKRSAEISNILNIATRTASDCAPPPPAPAVAATADTHRRPFLVAIGIKTNYSRDSVESTWGEPNRWQERGGGWRPHRRRNCNGLRGGTQNQNSGHSVEYDTHPKSLGSLRSYSHLQMFCSAYSVTGPPVRCAAAAAFLIELEFFCKWTSVQGRGQSTR